MTKQRAMPRREGKRKVSRKLLEKAFKKSHEVQSKFLSDMTKKRKRWVLGEGHTCTDMGKKSISLWSEWDQFGPKEMHTLKMPEGGVMATRYRLILEELP